MASPLGKLLARSPIAPIQRHMQFAQESVQLLCELIASAGEADPARTAQIHTLLRATCDEARALRHDIRRELPGGLLLAMPRPDLLTLVDLQQAVCTRVRLAAQPPAVRGLRLPPALTRGTDRLCSQLAEVGSATLAAIRELDEMLEQGFGRRERQHVTRLLDALGRQVARCDAQQLRLTRQVRKQEKALDALDALLLYRLMQDLNGVASQCGDVGEQLHLLLA